MKQRNTESGLQQFLPCRQAAQLFVVHVPEADGTFAETLPGYAALQYDENVFRASKPHWQAIIPSGGLCLFCQTTASTRIRWEITPA